MLLFAPATRNCAQHEYGICRLLNSITITDAIIAQDIAIVPQTLHDRCGFLPRFSSPKRSQGRVPIEQDYCGYKPGGVPVRPGLVLPVRNNSAARPARYPTLTGLESRSDTNPRWATPAPIQIKPTISGNLRLGAGSPAIDKGNSVYISGVSTDLDENPRIIGGSVDMGAYEVKFYTLTVSLAGSGSGSVSSVPTGIDCGTDCTESYADGTVVTLTAAAGTGSSFSGWSGACTNTSGDCLVTMSAARSVTATFAASLPIPPTGLFEVFLPLASR